MLGAIGGVVGGKLGPDSALANFKLVRPLLEFYRSTLTKDIAQQAVVDDLIALLSTRSIGASTTTGVITNILQAFPFLDQVNKGLSEFLSGLDEGEAQKWVDEH